MDKNCFIVFFLVLILYYRHGAQANSAFQFHPSGVGKWVAISTW